MKLMRYHLNWTPEQIAMNILTFLLKTLNEPHKSCHTKTLSHSVNQFIVSMKIDSNERITNRDW